MKDEKNTKPEEVQKDAPSRREFMRNAVLGAGAIAMISSQTSCETPAKKKDGSSSGQEVGATRYTPSKFNVTKETPENWPRIPEYNLSLYADLYNSSPESYPSLALNATLNSSPKVVKKDGDTEYVIDDYFSYNGDIPSPIIRTKGDATIHVDLWNMMPGNNGTFAYDQKSRVVKTDERWGEPTTPGGDPKPDWQIEEHLYGPHQQNVTNLHTHGLHVSPGVAKEIPENVNNIHSDNVLLRVIPEEDYINKKKAGLMLMNNEQVGHAKYQFKIGTHRGPHYPGTHWYHPHPHGATFDQVAGGMAGFIFVEGDVDDFLAKKYENNAYEELPLLIQRIFAPINSLDENDLKANESQKKRIQTKGNEKKVTQKYVNDFVNGVAVNYQPQEVAGKLVKHLTTNQVIRLRVLNGSVDGQGYIRLFIKEGTDKPTIISDVKKSPITGEQYLNKALKQWNPDAADKDGRVCMTNMAFDGVTLVDMKGDYTTMPVEWLTMSPANRADFLWSPLKAGTYTIWAQDMEEAGDAVVVNDPNVRVATLIVKDGNLPAPSGRSADGVLNVDFNDSSVGVTVTVPEELKPIGIEEITIQDNNETTNIYGAQQTGNKGKIRGRRVMYSGFGHASVVNSTLPSGSTSEQQEKLTNAMLIDGKKYGADTPQKHGWDNPQHRMIVNSAEEWTLYNYSMTVSQVTGDVKEPASEECVTQAEDGTTYYYGCPIYQVKNEQESAKVIAKSVHHPFHIHQNPFLCMSIQDRNGNELLPTDDNGVPIPRWQDVVYVPRNGGRVVFRSRFWDYTGRYVDHCHLLQHEDWGMMQAIEVLKSSNNPNADKFKQANYIPMPANDEERLAYLPGLNLQQMVGIDIGKVQETLQTHGEDLANLHFDPNDPTYFDQPTVKDIFTKNSPTEQYVLKYPMPDNTNPKTWTNTGLAKLMAEMNKAPKQDPGPLPPTLNNGNLPS